MSSTATLVNASLPTGAPSSVATSTGRGIVLTCEFYGGRPLPLPNTRALSDVLTEFEHDHDRRAALREARTRMADDLYEGRRNGLGALRMRRGFSQSALAIAAGTSQPHIAKIEAGKNDPSTTLIARLAGALGVADVEVFAAVRSDQTEIEGQQ